MSDPRPKTIFLDIDGVLLHQYGGLDAQMMCEPTLLPDVLNKLHSWDCKGYNIVLCTGRKESMRSITVEQLESVGIYYDQLIMSIGGGVRVLINNSKDSIPDLETAVAFTIPKNKGIGDLDI
jgi:predicted mannosyl-3-phosphoglycerate phosphatase (HAD superfamily)